MYLFILLVFILLVFGAAFPLGCLLTGTLLASGQFLLQLAFISDLENLDDFVSRLQKCTNGVIGGLLRLVLITGVT